MTQTSDDGAATLRNKLLDQEGALTDLRDAITALHLIAMGCAGLGIEADDLPGLAFLTRHARDLVAGVQQSWRDTLVLVAKDTLRT